MPVLERIFEVVGSLVGPWAYVAVGLLAAAESSVGVGLVVPGETAMIVGGFVVSQGNASYPLMLGVAVLGAVLGDSVGYEVGRRIGTAVRRTRLGRRIGEDRWQQAEAFLARRGGRAVFLARFVAVVRSLVPAVAGASRMPYRRFLLFNALGGTAWASLYVTVGFVAGRSWERVAAAAEDAALVVLVLVVLVVLVVVAARWASRHPESVRALGARVAGWRAVAWVQRTFPGPARFLQARFRLRDPLGLSLSVGFVLTLAAGSAFGLLAARVLGDGGPLQVDHRVWRALVTRRDEWVTTVMRGVTELGGWEVLTALALTASVAWLVRTRRWGVAVFLALSLLGIWGLTSLVKELVARLRPPTAFWLDEAEGFSFPSGHTSHATIAYGALAYLLGSAVRAWTARVSIWAAAVLVIVLVGFSRLYLGVHWLTDVVGGLALGAGWLAVVVSAFSTGSGLRRRQAVGQREPSREAGQGQRRAASSRVP